MQEGTQHSSVKGKNRVHNGSTNEKKTFFSSNSIHYKGSDSIEEGMSLVKLEKLASNLGDAGVSKPEKNEGFKYPNTIPNFNFAPITINGFTAVKDASSTSAAKASPARFKGYTKKNLWNGVGHKAHFKYFIENVIFSLNSVSKFK